MVTLADAWSPGTGPASEPTSRMRIRAFVPVEAVFSVAPAWVVPSMTSGSLMTGNADWGRIVFLALPVVVVGAAWVLNSRPRLAIATVVAFMTMNFGYVVYMEDLGGAQDGIIDAAPARYQPR